MRQFCPLGCSPCLIHHWMFYSIQPERLCGRCPDCGGASPAVGAHIIFSEPTVSTAAGASASKKKFVEDCGPMIKGSSVLAAQSAERQLIPMQRGMGGGS